MMKIYVTVGDEVKWVANPKGHDSYKGEKGNWKNVEGQVVVSDIEVLGHEDFVKKSAAISALWPNCFIRFMSDKKA